MARKLPIEVRAMLPFEKVWFADGDWTFQNPICSLVGVTDSIPEIFVYAQLAGGVGTYDLHVQLRAFDSDFALGSSEGHRVKFPKNRTVPLEMVFQLTDVRFPRSDLYEFQLIANHKDVTGGVYQVSVAMGDEP